jgi:hypothetical protein
MPCARPTSAGTKAYVVERALLPGRAFYARAAGSACLPLTQAAPPAADSEPAGPRRDDL